LSKSKVKVVRELSGFSLLSDRMVYYSVLLSLCI